MKPKRTTGFGLQDTARKIARRRQQVIEETETPPPPPMRLALDSILSREVFTYARHFKRPLAA